MANIRLKGAIETHSKATEQFVQTQSQTIAWHHQRFWEKENNLTIVTQFIVDERGSIQSSARGVPPANENWKKNIARIAKAALHKLPGKSSLTVSSVRPVCPVCPICPFWLVCPDDHDNHNGHNDHDGNDDPYLTFITDTTDGVCVKKNCPV